MVVCVTFVSLCVCVQPTPDGGACVSPGAKLRECLCTRGHVPVYSPLSLYLAHCLQSAVRCGKRTARTEIYKEGESFCATCRTVVVSRLPVSTLRRRCKCSRP